MDYLKSLGYFLLAGIFEISIPKNIVYFFRNAVQRFVLRKINEKNSNMAAQVNKIRIETFFDDEKQKQEIKNIIEERKNKKSSQYEIQAKTKTGEKICSWRRFSAKPPQDCACSGRD